MRLHASQTNSANEHPSICVHLRFLRCLRSPKTFSLIFHRLEAHVEAFDGMSKGTHGNEVHTAAGVIEHGVEGDAAR